MRVLGIETSCDETGVAVYDTEQGLLGEELASQISLHAPFGGVVPELASRDHAARLAPMVTRVLAATDTRLQRLDAIAYTAGPGLVGALMVGGAYAVALAWSLRIPAVPVHHMEGHLLAPMLEDPAPRFPFLALLVSGGHSQLVAAHALGRYEILGQTLDDAAGEAFDKVARLLDLPYPGGPAIAKLAESGSADAFAFPRPLRGRGLDFSFSGLKTAVRIAVAQRTDAGAQLDARTRADVAASFEQAVVDSLIEKCLRAAAQTGLERIVVAGGVGANRQLRRQLHAAAAAEAIEVFFPRPGLCTDNGAMIAFAGAQRLPARRRSDIVARARWPLDQLQPIDPEAESAVTD
jgi:N6-L-threonylcarbamoyladenine synthase